MKNKSLPLYIIFFGLPGSGKSMVTKELVSLLEKEGHSVGSYLSLKKISKFKKYIYPIFYILIDRETRKEFLRLIIWFFKFRAFTVRGTKVYWMIVKNYLARKLILNQGIFDILIWENKYHMISLFNIDKINEESLRSFMSFYLKEESVLIVYLKISSKAALQRAYLYSNTEKRPYLFSLNKKDALEYYKGNKKNQGKVLKILKSLEISNIIEIDGENISEDNANYIFKQISKYI